MSNEEIKNEDLNENAGAVDENVSDNVAANSPRHESSGGILADVLAERPKLPVGRQLVIVGALLLGVFSLGSAPFILNSLNRVEPYDHLANSIETTLDDPTEVGDPFEGISISARSAFVFDVKEGKVLFEREANLQWPLASITKLMTVLLTREIINEGAVIPVTSEALSQAGESGFKQGERFSYRHFSDLVLISSSNDGAYALAAAAGEVLEPNNGAAAFVKAMNVRAKELGLNSTYFRNPTGLDISENEAGAYGTAKEVEKLMEYIIKNNPDILEETASATGVFYDEAGERLEAENTNKVVESIGNVIASKTGYTTLAGGNLAVAFDVGVNHPVIVVVLGSTYQGRFSDVLRLVRATKAKLKNEI